MGNDDKKLRMVDNGALEGAQEECRYLLAENERLERELAYAVASNDDKKSATPRTDEIEARVEGEWNAFAALPASLSEARRRRRSAGSGSPTSAPSRSPT